MHDGHAATIGHQPCYILYAWAHRCKYIDLRSVKEVLSVWGELCPP